MLKSRLSQSTARVPHPHSASRRWRSRWSVRPGRRDAGMSTAEYAVATVAACAFAVVLHGVVTSAPVSAAMQGLVERALGSAF